MILGHHTQPLTVTAQSRASHWGHTNNLKGRNEATGHSGGETSDRMAERSLVSRSGVQESLGGRWNSAGKVKGLRVAASKPHCLSVVPTLPGSEKPDAGLQFGVMIFELCFTESRGF